MLLKGEMRWQKVFWLGWIADAIMSDDVIGSMTCSMTLLGQGRVKPRSYRESPLFRIGCPAQLLKGLHSMHPWPFSGSHLIPGTFIIIIINFFLKIVLIFLLDPLYSIQLLNSKTYISSDTFYIWGKEKKRQMITIYLPWWWESQMESVYNKTIVTFILSTKKWAQQKYTLSDTLHQFIYLFILTITGYLCNNLTCMI